MARSATALAATDPAPELPATMSYSAVLAAIREKSLCSRCGKTSVVFNIAAAGKGFRAERVTRETHCSCVGGPAYVAPAVEPMTALVCEFCGEERSRAEFYGEPCRAEQADGVPGPVLGAHSFVRVELDAPALGVER